LDAVAVVTDERRLHDTDVDADSPVTVDVLHRANSTDCATDMMFVDRQRNARVTTTAKQRECHVTLQDVKIPRDHAALLRHLHQNLCARTRTQRYASLTVTTVSNNIGNLDHDLHSSRITDE